MIYALSQYRRRYFTFITYCLVGAVSAAIDFGILIGAVEIMRLPLLLANTLSFSVAAVNGFYWNRRVTFKNAHPKILRQFFFFVLCALVGVLINNAVLFFMARVIGVWYVLGKAIATGVALAWNYSINKLVIFAK